MSAITLTLLLPGKSVPVQNWTFETESLIRVGRAADNDVVLYSAVVSRHHLELRKNNHGWEAVNIGANGTYMDGEAIGQVSVTDGMIVRLASSGPKIQIHLETDSAFARKKLEKFRDKVLETAPVQQDLAKDTVINPVCNKQMKKGSTQSS